MKTMTCKQLGGACDEEFRAETFEEVASLSRQHGAKMHNEQDPEHLKAMAEIHQLMQDPAAMKAWFDEKRRLFEATPEDPI